MIQQLFHALSLRERFLVAIFIWGLLLLWLLNLLNVSKVSVGEYRLQTQLLDSLRATVAMASQAEDVLRQARQGVDETKTYSAAQLVGRLDSLARENAISSFDISNPSTIETDLFSFHSVRLAVKRASIAELIQFDIAIKAHSPYIALTDFQISSNRRDPRVLTADLELVSFELKADALND